MGCTGYTRKIHSDVGVIINFYFAEKYRYKKRRLKNIFSWEYFSRIYSDVCIIFIIISFNIYIYKLYMVTYFHQYSELKGMEDK